MVRKDIVAVTIFVIAVVIVSTLLVYWNDMNPSNTNKHETDQWAIITDSKGDVIAIETNNLDTWMEIKNLQQNQTELWIGGNIEQYDNYWGFRFNPDTIIIAEITIEGAQTNIQSISEDLDYWINTWQKQTYVFAKVTEINE